MSVLSNVQCCITIYFREILERAINLKVSAKKMKFIFKRYLEFERCYGSPANMEAVKEKARTYVESRSQGMN